jgi:hypothetical protein
MKNRIGWLLVLALTGAADAATFTVTNANDTGAGSLRQAIIDANATTTPDIIAFFVSLPGVVQINLQSALPGLTQPVVIDGLSQSGGVGPPMVRIDGANLGAGISGLRVSAPGCSVTTCVVRGLQITRFGGNGIIVLSSAWSIRSNYIGHDGTQALANAGGGVRVMSPANAVEIGGTAQGEGNLISGNTGSGISLDAGTLNARVRGNRIGLGANGLALANTGSGVTAAGGGHVIGGNTIAARNVISGNGDNGVVVAAAAATIAVSGNYIGSNSTGTVAVPNAGGVRVLSANANVLIGGAIPGEGNLISGNNSHGVALDSGTNAVSVLGNLIGTRADGTTALPNQGAGITLSGSNHSIGLGSTPARNLISGNAQDGIDIVGVASGVTVLGNYIGTNAGGSAAVPNGGSGIRVVSASTNILIGDDGGGDGNLISGNTSRGIVLDDTSNSVHIVGNLIGTNPQGTAAIGNGEAGILLNGNNHVIGSGSEGGGNLISGNAGSGITSVGGAGTLIQGNYIGTDAFGIAAVANTVYGIRVVGGSNLSIGSSAAGAGNLISGNARGLSIEALASQVRVAGNILGLNATANAPIPNGSGADTISITGPDATIGGIVPGAGNIIAGNQNTAISVRLASASNAKIQGNWIGTNPALAANLGNQVIGILIDRADGVLIGGSEVGAGNVIANNGFIGILAENGTRNSVLGNAIFGNAPLQLDIAEQGPEENDPLDPDLGGNFRQNHPIIHSAAFAGGGIGLVATLASEPLQDYRVEFFQATACSPTGLGGASLFLGAQQVTTDAAGLAEIDFGVAAANANGVVTAIATAADGSSSEFSPCHAISGPNPGQFQVWRSPLLGYEGIATMKVTVVRSHGNQGAASVQLTTLDDTAVAPADYQALSTTLSFADGDVMRSVEIPIAIDAINEGQEQFFVQLGNPTGGATLGAQATVAAVIVENPVPFYAVSDGAVVEPASGTASIGFTISLSPSDTPRAIEYFTEDASAENGLDYVSTAGTLNFPASPVTQSQTVTVQVLADALAEPQESFYLRANGSGNIAVFDGVGEGAILPPGTVLPDALFEDGFE